MKEAMDEEINALHECITSEIVPKPWDKNVNSSKYKLDWSVERYKPMLVTYSFTQKYG